MAPRRWREWFIRTQSLHMGRDEYGNVWISRLPGHRLIILTPYEARRLFRKLSGDYRD